MGVGPEESSSKWNSPTLWGTVSEMASFLDTLVDGAGNSHLTSDQESKVRELVTDLVTVQTQTMVEKVRTGLVEQKPFLMYAKGVRSSIGAQSVETADLKGRMNGVEKSLDRIRGASSVRDETPSHEDSANAWLNGCVEVQKPTEGVEETKVLSVRLDKAEDDIRALIGEANASTISFGGLGLRSAEETRAWATKNPQLASGFGLYVDCFSLLEWILMLNAGADNLAKLKTVKEMGLATLAEAKAMNSFGPILPKLFLGSGVAPLVVLKNETDLPGVRTFAYWSNQGAGLRAKIGDELKTIREGITNQIKLRLRPGSPGYNLALLGLTVSIGWVESLLNFIDKTYADLIRSGFSVGSAWGLTTRLVVRIFEDIALVRAGVSSSFVIDDNLSNATTVLWATFQTHDAMADYLSLNFKNHPSISSEYVKFLASNSGIEAVGQLTEGFKKMGLEVKDAVGKITGATKQGVTACNKVDEVKTKIAAMERRLLKLESK
jgi:hypothetical protein